jgi:hypothetical protein
MVTALTRCRLRLRKATVSPGLRAALSSLYRGRAEALTHPPRGPLLPVRCLEMGRLGSCPEGGAAHLPPGEGEPKRTSCQARVSTVRHQPSPTPVRQL